MSDSNDQLIVTEDYSGTPRKSYSTEYDPNAKKKALNALMKRKYYHNRIKKDPILHAEYKEKWRKYYVTNRKELYEKQKKKRYEDRSNLLHFCMDCQCNFLERRSLVVHCCRNKHEMNVLLNEITEKLDNDEKAK